MTITQRETLQALISADRVQELYISCVIPGAYYFSLYTRSYALYATIPTYTYDCSCRVYVNGRTLTLSTGDVTTDITDAQALRTFVA